MIEGNSSISVNLTELRNLDLQYQGTSIGTIQEAVLVAGKVVT